VRARPPRTPARASPSQLAPRPRRRAARPPAARPRGITAPRRERQVRIGGPPPRAAHGLPEAPRQRRSFAPVEASSPAAPAAAKAASNRGTAVRGERRA
jgi:hypothetical protein